MAWLIVISALFIGVIEVVVRIEMLVGALCTFTMVALLAWRIRLFEPFDASVAFPVDIVVCWRFRGEGGYVFSEKID